MNRLALVLSTAISLSFGFLAPLNGFAKSPSLKKQNKMIAEASTLTEADDELYQGMKDIAQFFIQYAQKMGEFPSSGGMGGGSVVGAVQQALKGNTANPYYAQRNDFVSDPNLRSQTQPSLNFYFSQEDKVTLDQADTYKQEAPSEWTSVPGTIIGATDKMENWIIIWGAGADGKPIKNSSGNRLIVITKPSK